MKFIATFKDPDAMAGAIEHALLGIEDQAERNKKEEEIRQFVIKKAGSTEYLFVEFDTEADTCIVKLNRWTPPQL